MSDMFSSAVAPIILVAAIDFSEVSPLVVRKARDAARQMGAAQIHFVHVHPGSADERHGAGRCEQFGAWLGAQPSDGDAGRMQVLVHEKSGDPAVAIVELCDQVHASCVIVGARSRDGGAGTRLGEVARAVVKNADCPVLVVRPSVVPRASAAPQSFAG